MPRAKSCQATSSPSMKVFFERADPAAHPGSALHLSVPCRDFDCGHAPGLNVVSGPPVARTCVALPFSVREADVFAQMVHRCSELTPGLPPCLIPLGPSPSTISLLSPVLPKHNFSRSDEFLITGPEFFLASRVEVCLALLDALDMKACHPCRCRGSRPKELADLLSETFHRSPGVDLKS